MSPRVCAEGYVTATVAVEDCGVAAATWAKLIGTTGVYVNALVRLPLRPPGSFTVTVTVPAAFAGVVATIVVLLLTVTFVAGTAPNITVAPERKFVPVIVTPVPPVVGPLFG